MFKIMRTSYINITPHIEAALAESTIQEGCALSTQCICIHMHCTASVFINDDERGLHRDFERWLEKLGGDQ